MSAPTGVEGLAWLLDNLVEQAPKVRSAVVLSADGLLLASSETLGREDAEHLSAMASAFNSLARGVGAQFAGGGVRQTVVEMETAFFFVTAVSEGSCLAVLAAEDADVGLIAYQMALLVVRVGEFLTPGVRGAARSQVKKV